MTHAELDAEVSRALDRPQLLPMCPSSTWEGAGAVVEAMEAEGYDLCLSRIDGKYVAEFSPRDTEPDAPEVEVGEHHALLIPEAIAGAALFAILARDERTASLTPPQPIEGEEQRPEPDPPEAGERDLPSLADAPEELTKGLVRCRVHELHEASVTGHADLSTLARIVPATHDARTLARQFAKLWAEHTGQTGACELVVAVDFADPEQPSASYRFRIDAAAGTVEHVGP
jgi:hypothetical protein